MAAHNDTDDDPCAGVPVADEFVDRQEALAAHQQSIDCAFYWSITSGNVNGDDLEYNPTQLVRRDQMATFIHNTLSNAGYDLPAGDAPNEFTDITGNPNAGNINSLARAGIVRGLDEDTYGPSALIRRDQMASFIVQAAEYAVGDEHPVQGDGNDQFEDVRATNFHKGNIESGADADPVLFRGVSEGQFNPEVRVRRDQMASFLTNLFRYVYDPEQATTPTTVEVGQDTVPQGGEITGTIQGADSAIVSGCGFEDADVEDTDGDVDNESVTFTLAVPDDQETGECTLRFTVTRPNGQTAIRDVTITVEEFRTAVTEAPELLSAEFVRTTENPGTPVPGDEFQQTTVRYTFDEPIISTDDTPVPAQFHLVTLDGERFDGETATRETGNASILVVFGSNPNSVPPGTEVGETEFADTTIATVDFDAVQDPDGNANPEGDAPLNTITLDAGTTDAPDLRSLSNFRAGAGATPTTTLIDFTFDENAFVAGDTFEVVLIDNTVIECTAATTTGGDPVGEGTTKITVECPIADNANQQIPAAEVARGIALDGAVTDESGAGNPNPLQASDTPDGSTPAPDLVSVTLNDDNTATFTFDQAARLVLADVDANPLTDDEADPALFCLYDTAGAEECGTDVEQESTADSTVEVTFDAGVVDFAVGGNVRPEAVQGTDRAAALNSNDEEAVSEAATFEGGATVGPDLLTVQRAVTGTVTNPTTGQVTDTEITFTYTFDDRIAAVDDVEKFFIYDVEANRTILTECTSPGIATTNDPDDDFTVECAVTATGGTETGGDGNPANPGAGFAEAQQAELGTVDDAAVTDPSGDTNHEAAAPVQDV